MASRYFNCEGCGNPYDRNSGEIFSSMNSENFQTRGSCRNCFSHRTPLLDMLPKKPVIRECRDVAWANHK